MSGKRYFKDKLTDLHVRTSTSKERDYWLNDGGNLRLLVKTNGTKCWRYNYRHQGKQRTLAISVYPESSLAAARGARVAAKRDIKAGIDPSYKKQVEKRRNAHRDELMFQVIAKEWWEHQKGTWTDDHANRVWTRLKDNSFPIIGKRPIKEIDPQDVIFVVRQIEKRGALDVAQRVLQDMRRVCRYAVQTGKLTYNPAVELSDILKGRKTTHRASLPRDELPEFL